MPRATFTRSDSQGSIIAVDVNELTRTGCAGLVMLMTGTPGFMRGGAAGLVNSALGPIVE